MNRRLLTISTCAGALAAAMWLQMTAANADDFEFSLYPDGQTFDTELSTTPFQNVLEGTSSIEVYDKTTDFTSLNFYEGSGNEELNPFTGAVENWDLVITKVVIPIDGVGLTVGSQVDVMELGNGFANQFVDTPGVAGALNSIVDTLITPYGDFTLFSF